MSYSTDLRKRVLNFVSTHSSIAEASRRFGVSRTCIYKWLNAEDPLACKKPGPRGPRSIDYDALRQHVADFPDATQKERAAHFGVSRHGIWYALKKLNITRKKDANLQGAVSCKTPRVSLSPSAGDPGAWQEACLY